jgi:hypothetical protein
VFYVRANKGSRSYILINLTRHNKVVVCHTIKRRECSSFACPLLDVMGEKKGRQQRGAEQLVVWETTMNILEGRPQTPQESKLDR